MSVNKYLIVVSARIHAAPERVFAILSNFETEHPRILPKQFHDFKVLKGGIGAGTVISYQLRIFGKSHPCRARITEPQLGRVLVETILAGNGAVTTFTVTRGPMKTEADVTIATELPVRAGLLGAIERVLTTRFLRSLLKEELALLEARAIETKPSPAPLDAFGPPLRAGTPAGDPYTGTRQA